jgi:uncharacterized Ntn-hydrolase superfamily protein
MKKWLAAMAALLLGISGMQAAAAAQPGVLRPVHTYSIVARDPDTGQLGVAVQSHWFSVGSLVPWAEAGVGAVATQSFVEARYGFAGLELMRSGLDARHTLDALLAADEHADVRQVAMIDARGGTAVHTGKHCIRYAGHLAGENFTVQANLMLNAGVPEAMAAAFRGAQGSLAERMLAALEAGTCAANSRRLFSSSARWRRGSRCRIAWLTCTSRTTLNRWPSYGACWYCRRPTSS